ncbi:MAG: DNA topoisomerase 4 subunit A [Lachnospiraceae bacterium]|nr:DNA topoisomerase 4 subunit A [Lachnospiraceae bacterium]
MAKKTNDTWAETAPERILKTGFTDEMSKSYIDYSMSVITARAIPDVRDGLKPVQRRTLFAMEELGVRHDRPHRKSARIVGDTMGKYHPHGDSSIYDCLVVMAQDFKKGEILVDGHGNFGSIEGDGAAAMRYTEARLTKLSEDALLADLDKGVVDFIPNFDETEKEPVVLPARIPNLLVNGSEGIAVGMATNIPPHNLREVIDAEIAYLQDPDISLEKLMSYMPGPDFPTGGLIVNKKDLPAIYETGSGKIRLRGRMELEKADKRGERDNLVISEIPYTMVGMGIPKFISSLGEMLEGKELPEVVDITNQSSKEGIRIVLTLKNGADPERVKNILLKKTRLEDTFGVSMLAIVDGVPQVCGLKTILEQFTDFQIEVNSRKYQSLLDKEREKAEIQEGLIKAIDLIDVIIEIIRGSKNVKDAKEALMGRPDNVTFKTKKAEKIARTLTFTERQATAILEMRLQKLIGLEVLALQEEQEESLKKIRQYEDILNSYDSMIAVIKKDLLSYKRQFGRDRRTEIVDAEPVADVAPIVEERELIFAADRFGYGKTYEVSYYEKNKEAIEQENRVCFPVMSASRVYIFTTTGNVHTCRVEDLPGIRGKEKGTPLDNITNYDSKKESIVAILPESVIVAEKILFVTRQGNVKIVDGGEFISSRRTIQATKLAEDDEVLSVQAVQGSQLYLKTHDGFRLRFALSEVPEQKRTSVGVRGILLSKDDRVDQAIVLDPAGGEPDAEVSAVRLSKRAGKGSKGKK